MPGLTWPISRGEVQSGMDAAVPSYRRHTTYAIAHTDLYCGRSVCIANGPLPLVRIPPNRREQKIGLQHS